MRDTGRKPAAGKGRPGPPAILIALFMASVFAAFPRVVLGEGEAAETKGRLDGPNEPGYAGSFRLSWIDRFHLALSSEVQSRAEWFDSFFGSEEHDEEVKAATLVRLRHSRWHDEADGDGFTTRVAAQVTLPRAARRLNLFLGADEEEAPPGENIPNPVNEERGITTDLSLRYSLLRTLKTHVSTSLGLNYPLHPFLKVRYRHIVPFTDWSRLRFTETVYNRTDPEREGWEWITQVDMDRNLDPASILRWTNRASRSEYSVEGWTWHSFLQFFHSLSAKNALRYEAGLEGVTKPQSVVDRYVVRFQFRRNFSREWLFYELEPELSWRRDEFGDYRSAGRITARLEIQFQGGEWK